MDIYVLDNELTRVRTVATSSECLSATEELELGKAGQLTLSLPVSYKDTIKEMNILAIHDEMDRYRLYIVTNRNLNNYTLDIVAISYPNYALSRVGNVKDLRPNNRPLTELIPQILGNSGWTLNHVDKNLPRYTGSFYYLSRLECLSQISEALACEFDFYVTISGNRITGQFVDVVEMLGEDTNKRFEYGTNALEVVAEYDATEVYTQAVGRGKGEETGDGYGRRIEFTDVVWSKANGDPVDKPKGQNWVNDPYENYQLPGNKRPQKIIEFEEITDPNLLLEETYKWLLDNNHPKVQFKAKVVETGGLNLGDRVQIIRPDLDIRYKTRVFKLTRNLLNENLTEVEFGDNIATTPMDKLNSITTQVNSSNEALQRVEEQITMIDANGVRVNYGPNEPTVKKKGDIWYKDNPDGTTSLLRWNGEVWERVVDEGIIADIEKNVEDAMKDADQAKQDADTARNEASNALTKADTALTDALNASQQASDAMNEIVSFKGETSNKFSEINGSIDGININVTNLDEREKNNFTLLSGQLSSVLTNGVNMFPNSIFKDPKLSSYFMSPIGLEYFEVIKKRNSDGGTNWGNDNCLKITTNVSTNTNPYKDCTLRMIDMIPAKGGDTFTISFDYLKPKLGPQVGVWIRFRNQNAQDTWLTVFSPKDARTSWTTFKGELTAPTDTAFIQIMVGVRAKDGGADGDLTYLDNVLVNSTEVTRNQFVQTTNQTISKIENLEQKTDTKFLQTDELLAMQSQKIGAYYPNGDFSDTNFNKWYTGGRATITPSNELKVSCDEFYKGYALLTDYIPVEGDKPMNIKFTAAFSSLGVRGACKLYMHEYDGNKQETRNGSDLIFKNNENPKTWYSLEKNWQFATNPKFVRLEWVIFNGSGPGDMSIKNITVKNGAESMLGQISVMNNNINLSVKKGEVISEINITPGNMRIAGEKIHITGRTTIDNAVIKDAMIANLSASKLTAGTIDASKINVINLNANNITGINSQFIQTKWNGINSNIRVDGSGLRISKSDGENLLLSNGSLQWRDNNNKEIFGISRFNSGNIHLAINKGEQMSIMYEGDVDDNVYFPSMTFNGTTGSITFNNSNVWFQDRSIKFTTMDWGNGRVPSLRDSGNKVGIGLGSGALYLGDSNGVLTLGQIRAGELNGLKKGDRWVDFRNINFGGGSVFCIGSPQGTTNIGFGSSSLWLGDDQGAVTLNQILHACGLR